MKKVIILSLILVLGGIVTMSFFIDDNRTIYTNDKTDFTIKTNSLTMMYETDVDSGEYQVINSDNWNYDDYIFNSELSKCENGGTLTWDDTSNKVIMQTNSSDRCYVYFDKYTGINFAEYIKSLYVNDGDNGLYYHDGSGSYTNASEEAEDNSYRYSGANPNNYVCFGSEEIDCPEDNLFRIIGVFDNQIKLIKNDIITQDYIGYADYTHNSSDFCNAYNGIYDVVSYYYWSGSAIAGVNWENSTLNTTTLNQTYLNKFDSKWQQMINNHSWQVGGYDYDSIARNLPKLSYSYELGSNSIKTFYTAKIGLMYVSDYAYAASSDYWDLTLRNYDSGISGNWLYIGTSELLITPRTGSDTYYNFNIYGDEGCNGDPNGYIQGFKSGVVRPTFYLNENVLMISGDGTKDNPYRVSL